MTLLSVAPSVGMDWPKPRISHIPDYVSTAGQEAIDLAELAGLVLDEWQKWVLLHMMGEREDGKWAAFQCGLCVGRQNGKGAILEARELWGLFLGGEREIIHSAHEQLTATNHFRRLIGLVQNVPEFSKRVASAPRGKGSEAIYLHDGSRILFKTRTGDGGRGLTGDLVVIDEAMNVPDTHTAALVPTMSARSIGGNPQLIWAGSAVDAETDKHGEAFARIREQGIAKKDRVAYFEWSVPGDDPGRVPEEVRRDRKMWRQATPGLDIRISEEAIENECNGALSRRKFCVERLGIGLWPDTSEDAGRVIPRALWESLAEQDPANVITSPPVFGIDSNPQQTWASIAVAGKRDDGLFQGAIVEHLPGNEWVVERCLELKRQYRRPKFVVDRLSTASALIDALQKAKIRVVETTGGEYGQACMQFLLMVTERRFRYPFPQQDLDEALNDARQQSMGDAWKWSRRNSESGDISPLVALTLAVWGAQRVVRPGIVSLSDL